MNLIRTNTHALVAVGVGFLGITIFFGTRAYLDNKRINSRIKNINSKFQEASPETQERVIDGIKFRRILRENDL